MNEDAALAAAQVIELEPVPWTDPRLRSGWFTLALAALLMGLLPPRVLVNTDEYYYAGEAISLSHGHLLPRPGEGLPLAGAGGSPAAKYPIGWPLLLALGRFLGTRGMWVAAALAHLVGGAAFARMMVRRGLPAFLVAVWIFHPVVVLYGRTLMADVPVASALLVAMDAWEAREPARSAVALGWTVLARLASALLLAGWALSVLPEVRRRWRGVLLVSTTALTGLAADLTVNLITTGHALATPYAVTSTGLIGIGHLPRNALLYLGGLALLPPFPLVFLLARRRRVDRWALAAVPVLAFQICYGYHDEGATLLQTLVGGQRLVLPAIAVLSVATARAWGSPSRPVMWKVLLPATATAAAITILAARNSLERRYAAAAEALAACKPDVIEYNPSAGRVALSVDARSYLPLDGARVPSAAVDVVIVGKRFESNHPGGSSQENWVAPDAPGASCQELGNYLIYDVSGRCPRRGPACRGRD